MAGPIDWLKGLAGKQELDCQDIKDCCSEYVDEEMPAEMTQKYEAHVEECPDCDTFVETFRATVMTVRDLPRKTASASLKQQIKDRIARAN